MTLDDWINEFTTDLWTSMAGGGGEAFAPQPSGEMRFGDYQVALRRGDDGRSVRIVAVHHEQPMTGGSADDDKAWSASLGHDPRAIAHEVAGWLKARG